MNRHERRKQAATTDRRGADAELHDLLGQMLDHVGGQIRALAEEWIRDGKDITDLVIVIGVKGTAGKVGAESRREFAKGLIQDAEAAKSPMFSSAAHELIQGKPGCIPAVFCMIEPGPGIHVVWIQPISSEELH